MLVETKEAIFTLLKDVLPEYADEIREVSWRGMKFKYPAIRVQISQFYPDRNQECARRIGDLQILVFSDSQSSLEADTIISLVQERLPLSASVTVGSGEIGIRFTLERIIPAIRLEGGGNWMSSMQLKFIATLV